MTIESVTYISDLINTNPASGDPPSEGDDHIRNLKTGILTTFPNITGAVTSTHIELNVLDGIPATLTATELGYVDGVTSAIQTQIDLKAPLDSPAFTTTATLDGTTLATLGANTFTGDQTISITGQAADFLINSATGHDAGWQLRENDVPSIKFYNDSSANLARVTKFESDGSTTSSSVVLTEAGVINVSNGELQVGGVAVATVNTNWALTDITGVTSTVAELNILDGVTSTAAELNILDGVTSTAAELNILDGVTSTAAELNVLDGITSTVAELNVLDGIPGTLTATELGYSDGVTSAIQTQINNLAFRGALAHRNATQSIPNTTSTAVEFNTEASGYDTDSIHSTVTNPERFTVPAGVTRVLFEASIDLAANATGYRKVQIFVNASSPVGCDVDIEENPSATRSTRLKVKSAIIDVVATDYLSVLVNQTSGGVLNVLSTSQTWGFLRIIE